MPVRSRRVLVATKALCQHGRLARLCVGLGLAAIEMACSTHGRARPKAPQAQVDTHTQADPETSDLLAAQGLGGATTSATACPDTFVEAQARQGARGSYSTGAPTEEQHRADAQHAQALMMSIPTCEYAEGSCGPSSRATGCDSAEAIFACETTRVLAAGCPPKAPLAGAGCEKSGLTCAYPGSTLECRGGVFAYQVDAPRGAPAQFTDCPARM